MKQYHDLLRSILKNGAEHRDRTGIGTISHFGFQTRFDLRGGFPIVTTKRVPFRWVAEELFWFLAGDTRASLVVRREILDQFTVTCGGRLAEIIPRGTVWIRSQSCSNQFVPILIRDA